MHEYSKAMQAASGWLGYEFIRDGGSIRFHRVEGPTTDVDKDGRILE